MIQNGKQVAIEYTLSLNDGTTVDTNVGGEPLKYQHGAGEILPALERELAGLEVNDTKKVTLRPEEGFGQVNPQAFESVEPSLVPDGAREVGTQLVAQDPSGNRRQVRVSEVHSDRIVLDFNHPLAGHILHFQVKVVGVD